MSTVADLTNGFVTMQATVAEIAAKVDALKNQPPPVATQADLDALGSAQAATQAALDAVKNT